MKRLLAGLAVIVFVGVVLATLVLWLNLRGEAPVPAQAAAGASSTGTDVTGAAPGSGPADVRPGPDSNPAGSSPPAVAAQVARGAYLALAGNCAGCHTARGGAPYAGGHGIDTPFGTVYASNLTPDPATGIGDWSDAHFWRAMHHGRSQDGRLLYPAFPYTNYTRVTREDSDAIHAYLRSLPPVQQANRPHNLRFPYNSQAALAVWRALYFRPTPHEADPGRSPAWNRGAYLVRGLGHCSACHASRNALGASADDAVLGGGTIPAQNWYAPALNAADEAGVAHWPTQDIVQLLQTGVTSHASVLGPMAQVVLQSTQHLNQADLEAMATYLQALPPAPARNRSTTPPAAPDLLATGAKAYETHCSECHGGNGQGAPGIYPAVAGNRAVTMDPPINLVRVLLAGGFAPATAGHPRPYGMPPFATVLSDEEMAGVLSYIRGAWGNDASAVSPLNVHRYRGAR
jgi:mono/diheme cytochrome c family protein